eukprot:4212399-Amphidinium_carterae.1
MIKGSYIIQVNKKIAECKVVVPKVVEKSMKALARIAGGVSDGSGQVWHEQGSHKSFEELLAAANNGLLAMDCSQVQLLMQDLEEVWQVAENVFSLTNARMPADYEKDKEDLVKRARLTLSEAKLMAVFEQLGPSCTKADLLFQRGLVQQHVREIRSICGKGKEQT